MALNPKSSGHALHLVARRRVWTRACLTLDARVQPHAHKTQIHTRKEQSCNPQLTGIRTINVLKETMHAELLSPQPGLPRPAHFAVCWPAARPPFIFSYMLVRSPPYRAYFVICWLAARPALVAISWPAPCPAIRRPGSQPDPH